MHLNSSLHPFQLVKEVEIYDTGSNNFVCRPINQNFLICRRSSWRPMDPDCDGQGTMSLLMKGKRYIKDRSASTERHSFHFSPRRTQDARTSCGIRGDVLRGCEDKKCCTQRHVH